MRRLCLIISVIPAAAGFDVPAVDLNRGRFPSHPPSASQPGRRQRQQRLHTPLGHTHTHCLILQHTFWHTHTHTVILPQRKSPYAFFVFAASTHTWAFTCLETHTHPHRASPSWSSQVGDVEPLIGRAFISVLSIWWREGLHGLFGASLWAYIKGC